MTEKQENNKNNTSDYETPKVGSASLTDDQEVTPIVDLSRVGFAHYDGMSNEEATKTFREECLCAHCFLLPMCKVSAVIQESLTVVSRCLAYLPDNG